MERNVQQQQQQQQEHLQQADRERGVKGLARAVGSAGSANRWLQLRADRTGSDCTCILKYGTRETKGEGEGLSNNGTKCSKLVGPKSTSALHYNDNITQLECSLKTAN